VSQRAGLFLSLLLWLGSATAQSLPDRQEYAYRFPLDIETAAEYQSADLPLEVYQSVTDSGLRDLGVYNADGQAVPRVVESPEQVENHIEHETALGLVPLYGAEAEQLEQVQLLMQQGRAGTTLALDTRSQSKANSNPSQALAAYIIELAESEQQLVALEFDWTGSPAGFIGRVSVESSDDLHSWHHLAAGTLADLEYQETHIVQDRVGLPAPAGKFLRIRWNELPENWRLKGVSGIRRDRGPEERRNWLSLEPTETSADGRELVFETGGHPPIDRINLSLAGNNVVLRAQVLYRDHTDQPWRLAHAGVFYRVKRDGDELNSAAAAIHATSAAQWMVRIEAGAAPLADSGELRLELGWRPQQLVFLAQGAAPFELLTGRARDALEGFPQQILLGDAAIFHVLRQSGQAGTAAIGPREVVAGTAALQPGSAFSGRTTLLWIGLIGAVLMVGWLVLSLSREMRAKDNPTSG